MQLSICGLIFVYQEVMIAFFSLSHSIKCDNDVAAMFVCDSHNFYFLMNYYFLHYTVYLPMYFSVLLILNKINVHNKRYFLNDS